MSIRLKLLLAFSVTVLLAAGVAGYGFLLISSANSLVVGLYDGPMMGVNYARSAQLDFAKARRAIEKAVVLHEPVTAAELASIDGSMKQLVADIGVVKGRIGSAPGFDQGLDKILPLAEDWYNNGMRYLRPPKGGVTELPLPDTVVSKGNAVGEALDLIAENAGAYGFNFRSDAEAAAAKSKTRLTVAGVAVMLAGLAMAFGIAASFSRPIYSAMALSEEIASGNFTAPISTNRRDEIGRLLVSLNKTRELLAGIVSGIMSAAHDVSNAAAEIVTSTTDLSQRTEEQAASLDQTSASMAMIAETVKKNADNAQQANRFAADTRKVADRGGAVVADTVKAMSRIEDSSHKISNIIGVIDEIARQTNLLALNAAVEAARAGEAGRGFAVVASEVRTLAQRSSQAAKDIKDLINTSSEQVQEGVALVNRAGTSLAEILDSIKKVTDIVSDIATASADQANSLQQINKALSQMDEATQQNSALVEENAATAKHLEHQSADMAERVALFKLPETTAAPAVEFAVTNPAHSQVRSRDRGRPREITRRTLEKAA